MLVEYRFRERCDTTAQARKHLGTEETAQRAADEGNAAAAANVIPLKLENLALTVFISRDLRHD